MYPLITFASGRRVGFDAAGAAVNDLGPSAAALAGSGGWPRVIAVRRPEQGNHEVTVHVTAGGDWSLTAYLTHESGASARLSTRGTASGAGTDVRALHVGQPTEPNWYANLAGVEDRAGARTALAVGPVPSRGEVEMTCAAPVAGAHARLDVLDLVYFARLDLAGRTQTRRIVLVR